MGIEPPGADPIPEVGKDVAIYRRQSDGSSKLIVDTFNNDTPQSQAKTLTVGTTRQGPFGVGTNS